MDVQQYSFVRGHCEWMTHFLPGFGPLTAAAAAGEHRSTINGTRVLILLIPLLYAQLHACFFIFEQLCDSLQVCLLIKLSEALMPQPLRRPPCLHADICTPIQPKNGVPVWQARAQMEAFALVGQQLSVSHHQLMRPLMH